MAKTMTKDEIHKEAKERFQEIQDFEGKERLLMEDDKEFSLGEDGAQWEEKSRQSREGSGRSWLTIMRSNQFTDHIKNQQRQNKPSIKISPTDEGAQEKAATLRQGLVRHIQYESKANQARQAGFDDAVDEGRGHWIVKTEYVEGTFHQKIVVDPIKDSRSVWMDWRRERPDYSDCKYGFVMRRIPRETFKEKWPKATISEWSGAKHDYWFSAKDVTIAEYYVEMYKTRTLLEVQGFDDEGQPNTRELYEDELKGEEIEESRITNKREVEDPYWMWYKMNGDQILESESLPWKEIPIITVIGKEDTTDKGWVCKGLIRDIKQPLRLYNFLESNMADIIAKAPRAPWVGVEGQFEGYEDLYAASNTSDVATLEYKPISIGGVMAPPPQRSQYSVDLSNLTEAMQICIEDIKAITGIYDASIGQRSNETSGVAIRAREAQGNNANFHYIDNYAMAINHEGRVINSALNIIYDTARTVTIMGEDDEEKLQGISPGEDGPGLGTGNFNTTVSVGPSFNTQREQEAAGLLEMAGNSEVIQQIGMGKVVRAQDWSGKDGLADLIDAFVEKQYPGLLESADSADEDDPMFALKQKFEQVQGQLQEVGQQLQQATEQLEKAQADKQAAAVGKVENDKAGLQLEEVKLKIEAKKVEGELQIKQAELKLKDKAIDTDSMKADLDSATKLKMNRDKLETDLIVHEVTKQAEPKKQEIAVS